ncbi:hypothetical protein ACFYNO_06950 [Kitasatospora sp. NPDC006697]|uniref:hypothetical protein n=1 Tax=Kitasatospora sp. NPDC006697 TaxID=3364020 RepID=UPI003684C728
MSIEAFVEPESEEAVIKTCFVIGPIGNEHAPDESPELRAYEDNLEIFEKVILPACAKYGIVPVRADGIADSGEITEQICRHVLHDDLVIADISGGNANVVYELGMRHLIGKPTIHIGESGPLPFDLALIRTILFKRSRTGLIRARRDLESSLDGVLRNGFEPLTPARILLGLPAAAPAPATTDSEQDDPEAPGVIDRFARVEAQMGAMGETAEEITGFLMVVAELSAQIGPVMERASQPGAPMGAWLPAMSELAAAMAEPAAGLRESCTRFAGQMVEMDAAVRSVFELIEVLPREERSEGLTGFLEQMVGMSESTHEVVQVLGQLEVAMKWMTRMSRELRAPGKDISVAVKQVSGVIAQISAWEHRARSLM